MATPQPLPNHQSQDLVRVLRIIEYTGPRKRVERQIQESLHGTKNCGFGLVIRAATIGTYPEILNSEKE